MGWIEGNDDYYGNEVETWYVYRDKNGKFLGKIGLMDDTDLDYYVENPYEAKLGDEKWTVISYNEQDHTIYVK